MSNYTYNQSHKPKIFYGNYEERLSHWHEIRKHINQISDPVDYLLEIFQYCPRTKTKTDLYKKDTWLNGWQLIERNEYDLFDICLLLSYTIILTGNFKKKSIMIHSVYKKELNNNQKFNFFIEFENTHIDTYSMVKLNKIEFDNQYVLHYTINLTETINTHN